MEKYTKLYREVEMLNLFDRKENIIVSDVKVNLDIIMKYVRPEHEIYGYDSLQAARWLYRKYIKLQPEVEQSVDEFYWERMHNNKIIAIHMFTATADDDEQTIEMNNQLFYSKIAEFSQKETKFKILLLTDTEDILQKFEMICGDRLIYTQRHRRGSVEQAIDPALLARETVVDVYLAAKSDYFIGYRSPISNAVLRLKEWDEANIHLFALATKHSD